MGADCKGNDNDIFSRWKNVMMVNNFKCPDIYEQQIGTTIYGKFSSNCSSGCKNIECANL